MKLRCSSAALAAELGAELPGWRQPWHAGSRRWSRSRSRPVLAAGTVRTRVHQRVGADGSIALAGFTWGYPSE